MESMTTVVVYSASGLLCLAVAAFLAFTVYTYYHGKKYSHIPSPKKSNFYLGHLPDAIRMRKELGNEEVPMQVLLAKWQADCSSSIYVVHILTQAMVVVTDPDVIKDIVMQPKNPKSSYMMNKFGYLFGERFMGRGIFSIPDYDVWKPRRRMYDSAFKKSYLEGILPAFNGCIDLFLEKLAPFTDGVTPVPMKEHLSEVTLDVISKVAFGTDFTKSWNIHMLGLTPNNQNGKLTFLINSSFRGLQKSLNQPMFQILHPFEMRMYKQTARALRMIGRDCIKKRIEMVESGAEVPNDILTHILQVASTQSTVDIEELVDDFVTYYIAGQETTSNLLSFAVVMVHTHPTVLERLQAEVKEVLGEETNITKELLQKLEYTEQVLLETLRMHPPVPGIAKEVAPEGLDVGGYHVPGGTPLMLPSSVLCRMPEYFDEPDTFNPDRFSPENTQPSSFVFFPFGLGHRSCIGKHFALMEAKMILARLIQTYQVTLPSGYQLVRVQRTTMQPQDTVNCTIQLC